MENKVEITIIAKDLASRTLRGLRSTIGTVTSGLGGLAKSIGGKILTGFTQLKYAALAVGAATLFMGKNLAKSAISTTADLESMRMGFVTLLGSAEKADKTLEMIKKDAATTPFELKGLIQANQLLTSVTRDGERSEKFLLNIGKALAAMGKGQEELDRVIVNLQQVGAVGHATMMDIRQFAFAGIPIFDMLKEETGLTGEALSDFISEGQVSFEMLEEMFAKAGTGSGKFAKAFENQAGTLNQLISNLKDNFTILGSEILTNTGLFDMLKAGVERVVTFLDNNKQAIIDFATNAVQYLKDKIVELNDRFKLNEKIESFMNFVKDNQEELVTFAKNFGLVTVANSALGVVLGLITSPILIVIGLIVAISAALTVWQKDIGGVKTKTTEAINKVKQVFMQLMQSPAVQWFVNKVRELSTQIKANLNNAIAQLKVSLVQLNPYIKQWVAGLGPVLSIVARITGAIAGGLILVLGHLINVTSKGLAPTIRVATSVLSGILYVINGVTSAARNSYYWISQLVYKISQIRIPNLSAIASSIRGNASGSSFYGGGLTMVGERGPELVQLPRGSRINSASETRNMQGVGEMTNNITINGYNRDPEELANIIIKKLARRNQAQGLGLNLAY